ncbi:MAG: hypothetical protein ABSD29_00460 [Verrucomicrobiota bacterium]
MSLPQATRGVAGPGAPLHDTLNPPQASFAGGRAALILSQLVLGFVALAAWTAPLQAGTIYIPNASFESPVTDYAWPQIDSWQQTPSWTNEESGVFLNLPPYIDNCDGSQAAFLFAAPQAALFQDYDSTDWSNSVPTHAFNATFDVGESYTLTVAVLGGTNLTYPMQVGTTLQLSLYYRDASSNMVIVAATTITNSGQLFPTNTHFVDFSVYVPGVRTNDPWAGQNIGVQIASTVSPDLAGGYWDLDNVRLTETALPALTNPGVTNSQCAFTLQSQPGLSFEILASTNLALPLSNWTSLGTLTNLTGVIPFLDPATNLNRRFYQARQLP